jgi:hypothetical protein
MFQTNVNILCFACIDNALLVHNDFHHCNLIEIQFFFVVAPLVTDCFACGALLLFS